MRRHLPAALGFVSGWLALSYEILWFRLCDFASRSRASSTGYLLAAYLLGLAGGALAARAWCTQRSDPRSPDHLRALAQWVLLSNLIAFLVAPATARFAAATGAILPAYVGVAIAMLFLGACFPVLVHLTAAHGDRPETGLTRVYVANVLGSMLGALFTGLVLLDAARFQVIAAALAIVAVLSASTLLSMAGSPRRAAATLALAPLVAFLAGPLHDRMWERLQLKREYAGTRFADVVETRSGVITVDVHGVVYGDGAFDGIYTTDVGASDWIVRAYAVAALHEAPKDILVVGLGSGSWTAVLANLPGAERVTVVETNGGHLGLIAKRPAVAPLLDDSRVEIHVDDGRRWLERHPDRTFDVVVSNTRIHWRSGSSHVLSREFFGIVKRHLNPGGILYYNATHSPRSERTGLVAFAHALRVGSFIAASDAPLRFDRDRFRAALERWQVYGRPAIDLSDADGRARLETVVGFSDLETGEALSERTAGASPITDDNMGTEWDPR